MRARDLHRPPESRAVGEFLASASAGPAALLVEGEPGIGKTTVWLAAVEEARARGFVVLSARASAAEARLAHASLADLLRDVAVDRLAGLPPPQRLAVRQVLQLAEPGAGPTDPQAIGAALLSVLTGLAAEGPVLLAVDDVQWLDSSSAHAIAFAARRLTGPVGVLATVRTEPRDDAPVGWLQLPRPGDVVRMAVGPLSGESLHLLLTERLGRRFPRRELARIEEISRGNPFYALELGRVLSREAAGSAPLPATLAELVRVRIGTVGDDLRAVLLAAASLAEPTVDRVQRACDLTPAWALELVEEAEERGLLAVDGPRLRFSHPLLAAGVRSDAAPAQRREMDRRLAEVVGEPEQRARHLALAAVDADPETLEALDGAALLARIRGAPAAAAELLELAIGLGGGSPQRRLLSAQHHFAAGDTQRARTVLEELAAELPAGQVRARTWSVLGLVRLHDDSFAEAAALLAEALTEAGPDLRLRAETMLWLAHAELNSGRLDGVEELVENAVAAATELGDMQLLAQAEGFRVMTGFVRGDGLDESGLARALRLGGGSPGLSVVFRPSVQAALLRAWRGDLARAADELRAIRRACTERGEESDLVYLDFQSGLVAVWRGDLGEAAEIADTAWRRARLLDRGVPLAVAKLLRALVAVHAGRFGEARAEAEESLEICRRCGWSTMVQWPLAVLALLELSLGNHEAVLHGLEPLLGGKSVLGAAEIISSPSVPDAIEALVQLGRLEEAEALLKPFELAGRRSDRAWAMATGGRCRSMLLAARGEVEAACEAAAWAMAQHERLPMPFEQARTQLLLGQLLRRLRKKESAAVTLRAAAQTFERVGTPVWEAKARAELARVGSGSSAGRQLTPSEQRVAELAATGMTNREVAAELFISAKTVEANLSRIYRKLEIRSRAELGRLMGTPGS